MRDLESLLAGYSKIDALLDEVRATSRPDPLLEKKVEERQRLNDQAYFVLCWGQLEATISEECRTAIRKRAENPDWTKRRGRDLYNPDDKRLSGLTFEERASLIIDKKAGGAWKLLMRYYETRNRIAHGNLLAERIELSSVVTDFYQIQSEFVP